MATPHSSTDTDMSQTRLSLPQDGLTHVSSQTQEGPEESAILKGVDKGDIVSRGAPQISKDNHQRPTENKYSAEAVRDEVFNNRDTTSRERGPTQSNTSWRQSRCDDGARSVVLTPLWEAEATALSRRLNLEQEVAATLTRRLDLEEQALTRLEAVARRVPFQEPVVPPTRPEVEDDVTVPLLGSRPVPTLALTFRAIEIVATISSGIVTILATFVLLFSTQKDIVGESLGVTLVVCLCLVVVVYRLFTMMKTRGFDL